MALAACDAPAPAPLAAVLLENDLRVAPAGAAPVTFQFFNTGKGSLATPAGPVVFLWQVPGETLCIGGGALPALRPKCVTVAVQGTAVTLRDPTTGQATPAQLIPRERPYP